MARIYPGYEIDERCRVRPGPETETLNFTELKELLLSTDLTRNEELNWVGNSVSKYKFLDGSDMTGNQVAF